MSVSPPRIVCNVRPFRWIPKPNLTCYLLTLALYINFKWRTRLRYWTETWDIVIFSANLKSNFACLLWSLIKLVSGLLSPTSLSTTSYKSVPNYFEPMYLLKICEENSNQMRRNGRTLHTIRGGETDIHTVRGGETDVQTWVKLDTYNANVCRA
jgi:hypothetical protein